MRWGRQAGSTLNLPSCLSWRWVWWLLPVIRNLSTSSWPFKTGKNSLTETLAGSLTTLGCICLIPRTRTHAQSLGLLLSGQLRPQAFPGAGLLLTSWSSFKFTRKWHPHRTESKVMQTTAVTWDYSEWAARHLRPASKFKSVKYYRHMQVTLQGQGMGPDAVRTLLQMQTDRIWPQVSGFFLLFISVTPL